ncbi:MAG: tellurium resistance protein [Pseudomonadota bacterium]
MRIGGEQAPFWRRTPPALFPATLGMFGLALAWRAAGEALGAPALVGHLILAATGAFFLFAFGCYAAKLVKRPAVVMEDLAPAPGRAAVSAGSMCLMLFAAGIAPLAAGLASAVWLLGVALHVVYMICVIRALMAAPPEGRAVTPVLFLPFVGYIVSPIAGVPLGFGAIAAPLYAYTLVAGAVIVALSAPRILLKPTPIPARPAAAILLAPTSVAAISANALGYDDLAAVFIWISAAVALVYVGRWRWLTVGGYTPAWGAFTFPSAALAGALLIAAQRWGGPWEWAASLALIFATVLVPAIWAITIRDWSLGRLGLMTGAGEA